MKRPIRRWLMIDTIALRDLTRFDHETIGAALLLVAWQSQGHEAPDDETLARVCGLSRTKWKKRGAAIVEAAALLRTASEPRAQFKRTPLSATARERIFARDGRVCRYCGDTEGPFHIDHVIPFARGGTDADDNLCVACAPCNFAKAASLNSEWNW
jgi:hypothetical protein